MTNSWVNRYLGKRYNTQHPCMALVLDVLEHEYGVQAPMYDEPLNLSARKALAYQLLTSSCRSIDPSEARDGDIVLIKVYGVPAHVGILVNSKNVAHVPDCTLGVVVESLDSPFLRNRIEGFYRPAQLQEQNDDHGN